MSISQFDTKQHFKNQRINEVRNSHAPNEKCQLATGLSLASKEVILEIYFDMTIFFGGWLAAQILFKDYEAHVPLLKRLSKLGVLFLIFFAIYYFWGRWLFYSLLGLMAVGIGILHGYWFHVRHGIHWRTAEPREKYLRLIGERD